MIDYNSNKVIMIYFMAGAAGKFLLSVLSLSPEILPPKFIYKKSSSIYDFKMTESSTGKIAECDNIYRFFSSESYVNKGSTFFRSIPFSDMKTCEDIFDYINNNSSDYFRESLADDIYKIPMIGHYIYPGITIFPNAKNLFIDVSDFPSKRFQMRAKWEKVHRKLAGDRTVIYQKFHENWFYPDKITGQDIPETGFRVNIWKIISGDVIEYERVCDFLDITPSEEYTTFADAYYDKQWKRKKHDKK